MKYFHGIKENEFNLVLLFLFFFLAVTVGGFGRQQEPLKYEVEVDFQLVPLFAVDEQGTPVYDLRAEEIELYISGRPVDIHTFKRYELQTAEEQTGPGGEAKPTEPAPAPPQRVVFIIVDTMFTSEHGMERSREIAAELIRSGTPSDIFIVLGNTPAGGLQLVGSSESTAGGRQQLLQRIEQLELAADNWDQNLHRQREWFFEVDYGQFDPRAEAKGFKELQNTQKYMEQMRYKNKIINFSRSLKQFEYALKSIDKAKLAFLISEGPQKGALKELPRETEEQWPGPGDGRDAESGMMPGKTYSVLLKDERTADKRSGRLDVTMVRYLDNVVKAINQGGTVLYTINPEKVKHDEDTSGEESLRMMAHESGGQYFAGTQTSKIVRQVTRTTAAYYEVFFPVKQMKQDRVEVEVKCKRPGVRIHSLRYSEQPKPYSQMKALEKKMFAVNVLSGGAWSQMAARPVPAAYQKFAKGKVKDKEYCGLEVKVPDEMKDRPLDLFLVDVAESDRKVAVEMKTVELKGEFSEIEMPLKKNRRHFFMLIDPVSSVCIYSAQEVTGKISESADRFDVFFERFRADEEFQRSRVTFPFRQQHHDPVTGDMLRSKEVAASDWAFVDFRNTPEYSWSEPEVQGEEARLRLEGGGLDVTLVFQFKDLKWFLVHSENRSQGG